MGKMKIGFNCRYLDRTFVLEIFVQWFIRHRNFVQIPHFDLLPCQLKG